MIGCNYWSSNAGTEMWRQWDAKTVENDFKLIKEAGLDTLRMFINWRDFQPVKALYTSGNQIKCYCMEDLTEPTNPWFLDEVMLDRFSQFCDLADKYGFKLIVGLVTGWMSGRLFAPTPLEYKNVYTDPVSLKFQIKLVTGIVSTFKDRKCIYAWNLGNECNCMSSCPDSETAFAWSALISNTIRACDPTRPVISGMHGLYVDNNPWLITDQAECTDMLTTHPYAYFVRYCQVDPTDSIRTLMHGTAESLFYSHIGGRPTLVEELGSLSYSLASDEASARFMRINLLSNWAENSKGVLWWCAHEQNHLETPPYSWVMLERELGLMHSDFTPKKYLTEMTEFSKLLKETKLTQSTVKPDVGVILTRDSDQWGQAYMSFILLKQAGFEPQFIAPNTDLPDFDAYVMPSCHGQGPLFHKYYLQLKEKVRGGATVYISNGDGFFSDLNEFFGFNIKGVEISSPLSGTFSLGGKDIPYSFTQRRLIDADKATVLAVDSEDNPILLEHAYGAGKVVYLSFPMEDIMLTEPYAFDKGRHYLFESIFSNVLSQKPVIARHPKATVTINGNTAVILNLSLDTIDPEIILNGVSVDKVYKNSLTSIPACDGVIFTLK